MNGGWYTSQMNMGCECEYRCQNICRCESESEDQLWYKGKLRNLDAYDSDGEIAFR